MLCAAVARLLQEHEEHGSNETPEGHEVIPLQRLALEEDDGEEGEDGYRDNLLDNLELHQREGSSIAHKPDTVCRHLAGILEERQEPTDENDDVERCIV